MSATRLRNNLDTDTLSRKDFLTFAWKGLLALSGLLGLGGLAKYLSFQPEPALPTEFDLGPAADYPPGSRTLIPQAQAVLIHDGQRFTAISLICPHLGCIVETNPKGFICPCHGSGFDLQGALQHGPAAQSLHNLDVETRADGHLFVHLKSQ